MFKNAKFFCDQHFAGNQGDSSNANISSPYMTTQICGPLHGAIKLCHDDYERLRLEQVLDLNIHLI